MRIVIVVPPPSRSLISKVPGFIHALVKLGRYARPVVAHGNEITLGS
jgi:hypothetical protein